MYFTVLSIVCNLLSWGYWPTWIHLTLLFAAAFLFGLDFPVAERKS